jgi:hypothetical protein
MMCDSLLKLTEDETNTNIKTKTVQSEDNYNSNNECLEQYDGENGENGENNDECEEYDEEEYCAEYDEMLESGEECDDESDEDYPYHRKVTLIGYNLKEEQNIEKSQYEYHKNKSTGDWHYAKMIVLHSYQNKNNTEFFFDHLDKLFQKNSDCMNNVVSVFYKNDLDIDIVYEFKSAPGIHLLDNLRIPAYKPDGIIFSNAEDTNKWSFKIVVLTKKGIYTANRYISDDIIGCY